MTDSAELIRESGVGVCNRHRPKGVNCNGWSSAWVFGVEIVGLTDDVVLTNAEGSDRADNWMNGVKLMIAHHKTEVLLVSNCEMVQHTEITDGGHVTASGDQRTYKDHAEGSWSEKQ